MPAVTYLSDSEIQRARTVEDDKECAELLQELRKLTGEEWLIEVRTFVTWTGVLRAWGRKETKYYTLYVETTPGMGEYQVLNLITPAGGSNFNVSEQSRTAVMNFMLGKISDILGKHSALRGLKAVVWDRLTPSQQEVLKQMVMHEGRGSRFRPVGAQITVLQRMEKTRLVVKIKFGATPDWRLTPAGTELMKSYPEADQ